MLFLFLNIKRAEKDFLKLIHVQVGNEIYQYQNFILKKEKKKNKGLAI